LRKQKASCQKGNCQKAGKAGCEKQGDLRWRVVKMRLIQKGRVERIQEAELTRG